MAVRYETLDEVARGPRFAVFRAHSADQKDVVLKRARADRPEMRNTERLRHEYDMLCVLEASGAPRALDFTVLNGDAVLVEEDAGAYNLAEVLNHRPLATEAFLDLAVEMARAVAAAHAHNVIHRDICPENFVIDEPRSKVTLVDFDSATVVPAFAGLPGLSSGVEGTLAYMAPELTGRTKCPVDHRSDLYALGATFYEMLTGQPPFSARDPLELAHAHAARAPYPPALVAPTVPPLLSDIVVKLLAKMPEWRYQTAEALVDDLEEARRRYRETGRIEPFELGREDVPYGLLHANTLYGREDELPRLTEALERVKAGGREIVIVTGAAGIGKSALVNRLRDLASEQACWIETRGDRLRSHVPYAPLIQAFSALAVALVAEEGRDTFELRERVQHAILPNGGALLEVAPELRSLIGDQPPPMMVSPVERENRFQLVFSAFVRALLAEVSAPILFIDDLQWLDPASLKLVTSIATDAGAGPLLTLLACRSEDLETEHPAKRSFDSMRSAGARVTSIELGPLDKEAMLELFRDALRAEPGEVAALSEVVERKTGGNPFFIRQFLRYLHRERLLSFDAERARWTWNLERIEKLDVTPNVAQLLAKVIDALPEDARRALEVAACIGAQFELAILADLLEQSSDDAARALWVPVQQGLLVAVPEGARFSGMLDKPIELGTTSAPAFRFAHDQIQEAAYQRLPEAVRNILHRRIGRWLEQHVSADDFDALFEIVDQLDRCTDQVPEAERQRIARLHARAGSRAHHKGALESALGYYRSGLRLLRTTTLKPECHGLWFELVRNAAECAGLLGDLASSEALVAEGIARTDSIPEKAELYSVGVRTNTIHGKHTRAIELGLEGLALLGVELPLEPSNALVASKRRAAQASLHRRTDSQLLNAPLLEDPIEKAKLQLFIDLSSTWFVPSRLFQVVACLAVELTARQGVAPGSALAYSMYAIASSLEHDYDEGYRCGLLSVQLAERLGSASETARVLLEFAGHVAPWIAQISEIIPMLQRSHSLALESGELEFAAYASANLVFTRMSFGAELNQVLLAAEQALAFYRRTWQSSTALYVRPFVQAVRCLRGTTRSFFSFDDDTFEEARFRVDAADNGLAQAVFHILKLETYYLFGNLELAWKCAIDARPWLPYLRSLSLQAEYQFYTGLTAIRMSENASRTEREAFKREARAALKALKVWSHHAPLNYRQKDDILAAELARIEDRPSEALALYHDAIGRTASAGFVHEEAIAQELCGRFLRAQNRGRIGELHLAAAVDTYTVWGALGKVDQLAREFPSVRPRGCAAHLTKCEGAPALDYLGLAKASEALIGELVFDRLLVKLVQICGEIAGATRTVLVLDEDGLVQRAAARAGEEVSVERRPIAGAAEVPAPLIERVFRSKEVLLLGDATREGPYTTDPYVSAHQVHSILAVPILHGDRTLGVVYFENDLTHSAFTEERAAMFRLFSAQMAIALENSQFFEQRNQSERALRVLSETSAEFAETLDRAELLAKIEKILVPSLADWCLVDALDEQGVLRPIAWAHKDPSKASKIHALRLRHSIDAGSSEPPGQVLRLKKSLLFTEVTDETLGAWSHDEEGLSIIRSLAPNSVMSIPLTVRGRTIGVVSLVRSGPGKPYEEADLGLAEEVVRRFGFAIDNARLYRELQEALRERKERDRYLRMMFRQLPGAVWAVDRDLRVMYTTGRLLNAAGIEPRKLIGVTVREFVGTNDPTDVMVAHHLGALAGEVQSFEYLFLGRWYAMLIEPLVDQDKRIVGCVAAGFDITERREIAERLARSEHRLQEAQRVAHVGSFEWDIQPNVMSWSDELQRIYGFEPGEFGGTFEDFMDRLPADEVENTRKVIFNAYARLIPFTFDHRIVRKDGVVRVLHSRGDFTKDESGKAALMVGTSWDVTEQRDLFNKLELAVSRWEATVNATAEGILVVDLDENVAAVNQRLRGLWQLPETTLSGVRHLQLLAPVLDRLEDPDGFQRRVREVYAHKNEETFDVIRFKDGRVLEWYSIPQRIGDQITGRVWSFRDVTERERLLRRALFLADATRLLASLDVEQALDGVARLAVPYLGDGCAIDLFGDGGPRRLIAISRDPSLPMSSEVHPTALAGNSTLYRVGAFSYMGVPMLMKGNVIGVITLSAGVKRRYSATDLELAEELARRAALAIDNARLFRGAQDALRSRDEFLSIAAHEIRGPVHAIHMAVQSIRQAKVSAEEMPKLLEIVERQDRRISQFVEELLELGRARTGRLQLEYEPVNLGDVVREAAVRLGSDAARSGSTLTITARRQIVGQWDKSRLEQVVFNLVSNAIKFGLGKPIEITMDSHDGRAVLIVRDHGIGVTPDMKERIFKPFERGVSDRHYGGLGLGLHIAKTIVDALGGEISMESEPERGSTFTVVLPERQLGAANAHLTH